MRSRSVCFVAMSGVRIYDPELRAMGMTLPGFVERGQVIASLPSLGLLTIAGATPPHWELHYREIDALDDAEIEAIVRLRPDLVALSSLTARIEDAYILARALRSEGIPVVLGGLHASAMPEEAAAYVDAVVVGQGEAQWPQVLADFEAGAMQAIYVAPRTPQMEPPTLPAYHLLDFQKYNRITLQTSRGCPLDCAFCGASRLISDYGRKPIQRIEAELEAIASRWPRAFIELADDNTFVHKRWGRELVAALAKFGVRWFTETDVSIADDPVLIEQMAESGCAQILIGFESLDKPTLDLTDSKGWKSARRDRYLSAIDAIQSRGVSVNGCFVFGFDTDGPDVFETTADFVRESGLSEVQVTLLTPFPGTRLFRDLADQDRLLKPRFWDECTLFDTTFRPARMSPKSLQRGFRELVSELYSQEATRHRKAAFAGTVRRRLRHASSLENDH